MAILQNMIYYMKLLMNIKTTKLTLFLRKFFNTRRNKCF